MSAKWSSLTTFKFVEEYRQQRCLWDPQDKEYKSKDARDAALREIVRKMNIKGFDMLAARKKVRTVRSTYWNEKAKILRSMASARFTESTYKPKLLWYTLADEFLKVTVTAKESLSHSTMINDDCDDTVMFIKEECQLDELNDEANFTNQQTKNSLLFREINDNEQDSDIYQAKASNKDDAHTEEDSDLQRSLTPPRAQKYDTYVDGRTGADLYNPFTIREIFKEIIANTREENEFDLFGKIVACHLKKLPETDALELEMEIMHLILTRRLNHTRNDSKIA